MSQVDLDSSITDSFDYKELTRRQKRSLIFHFLYAIESFDYDVSLESIVDNFNRGFTLNVPLQSEVVQTVQQVVQRRSELDDYYKPLLSNWRFDRLGVSTRLILRFALWEFLDTNLPSVIIINEAIELAKCFAEKDSYKFINGILDEVVKTMPSRVEEHENQELPQEPDQE